MFDWIWLVVQIAFIYLIARAVMIITKVEKNVVVLERPPDWVWLTWKIYCIQEAYLKPIGKHMPAGMTLVFLYFIIGAVGYPIMSILKATGVVWSGLEVSLFKRLMTFIQFAFYVLAAVSIFKRLRWGWILITVLILFDLSTMTYSYFLPPEGVTISLAKLLNYLMIPIIILAYTAWNKAYFSEPEYRGT
jgi:hypothetical protein